MVMKMVEAQTQTVEEMLLEGARRIGELAEKEAEKQKKMQRYLKMLSI